MRRLLLIVLGLVWVAATATTWEAGRRAEREYRALVAALREDATLAIEVERYDRGIFGSSATTTFGFAAPGSSAGSTESGTRLILTHEIDHGPYPLSYVASEDFDGRPILVRVSTAPMLEIESEAAIEEIPLPVSIEALFTRAQGATLWMVPDPARPGAEDPELSADWDGVYAEIWFRYDGSATSGELEIPRLSFEGADGAFRLADLLYEFDYEQAAEGVPAYVGGSRFRVGLLSVEDAQDAFTLRDFELEDTSEAVGGVLSLQVEGSFDALEAHDRLYGNGALALALSGLALEPLAELGAISEAVSQDGADAELVKAELMGAAGALWPKLMAAGPSFEMSQLRLATPEGEIRMAFRLGVDTSEPAFLAHPFMTLPALELDAELSLPEPVLHAWLAMPRPQLEPTADALLGFGAEGGVPPWAGPAEMAVQRVETWLERGFIDRHDGRYAVSVRVRQGTIRLNGRVVSSDAL